MRRGFMFLISAFLFLNAETLFEVKDSSNNKVLDVSTDGLRIMNLGDTLMVISPSAVKVNLDNSSGKALSRTFSVTTTSAKGKGLTNVMEVGTMSTTMREGTFGDEYTNFSPQNLMLGLRAGRDTSTGVNNIFIGNESGTLNGYGDDNIYIGYQAGYRNDWASENIFIGNYAGYNNDTDDPFPYGSMNVFLGTYSGYSNIDGFANTFLGYRAGEDNRGAVENTFVGGYAGSNNNSGRNSALGVYALGGNTSGTQNTSIGTYTGINNLTGSRNVFLGYSAGYNETGSDKLYIENSNSATPLIWGDFANDMLRFNGNVGINASPSSSYGLYIIDNDYGIRSIASTSTGTYTYGVLGDADGGTARNVSIYGSGASGTGTNWAGYFYGDVYVLGTVSKAGDKVVLDHPLDPENKFLSHTSINSDQMTNIYHGNVILDSEGNATVIMQNWVEDANKDFRYQLTAIGAPGPNLYISKKINGNKFSISGGASGMEVSWQVTGLRNDNYAKANPITVETDKTADEKGLYLHPDAFGLPEEKGIEYQIQKKNENLK